MCAASRKGLHRATLSDVGKIAGVSAMAASAVLNGTRTSARISKDTEERIRAAAIALKYRPNIAARALVNRRMHTIGVSVVIDGGELNNYFVEVFNGIIEESARRGQNATVFTLQDWKSGLEPVQRSCDGRIDGMILIAPVVDPKKAGAIPSHTPFVSLHANSEIPGMVNLEADEESGAFEMVNHLIEQGHRRILHISPPSILVGAQRRLRGYERSLQGAALAVDPALIATANGFGIDHGRRAMAAWMHAHAGEQMPDAIFCASDSLAVGCMEVLAEADIRVPDDISICGFDDTLAARTTVPQLTTVRQPLRRMGREAVGALLERIEGQLSGTASGGGPAIVYPTEIVHRRSVRQADAAMRRVPRLG